MKAKIRKLDPPKYSRNGDVAYQRVYFELEDGTWAATDLVSSYRNYQRWKPIIKAGIGTTLGGVYLKDGYKDKVNADSEVYIIQKPLVPPAAPEPNALAGEIRKRKEPDGSTTYLATGSRGAIYEIKSVAGILRCTCESFRFSAAKQCKHTEKIKNLISEEAARARAAEPKLF